MKLLTFLLGLLFVFSITQKAMACDCDKAAKKDRTTASQTVADAKDTKSCESCGGESCTCEKGCKCGGHKDGKSCDSKSCKGDGKSCGCGKDKKVKT